MDRLRAAASHQPYPARPRNALMKAIAAITAVSREISYLHLSPVKQAFWVKVPPLGTVFLLLAYLGFVLALEFINNDVPGAQHYQALGIRAAWLAVAQVPLLILLAGKNNIIGWLTGTAYERLNILHRWTSRILLLLATLHFAYQNYGWNLYNLRQMEWDTDSCPPTGIAAYAILLWMNLTTVAPLRNLSYEFFVIQHIFTFFGFLIAVMMHLPSTALYSRVYIYIPIVLYFLDRLVRTLRFTYNNLKPGRAELTAMEGGVTKVRVSIKHVKKWWPGAHVLLKIPSMGILQSHPATIVSIPSSHNNDLVFILRSHRGFTERLLTSATSSTTSLLPKTEQNALVPVRKHTALIDGPYGGSQADLAAFDSVFLIAGSTGVTFTLSLLLDIAHRASTQRLPIQNLQFVWVVKDISWTSWISDELVYAFRKLHDAGVAVEIKVFVTCDDSFTESSNTVKRTGCQCDESLGPCCCIRSITPANRDESTSTTNDDLINSGSSEEKPAIAVTESQKPSPSPPPKSPCCSNKNTTKTNTSTASALSYVATFHSGRPDIHRLLSPFLENAQGESGIAVCGPLGLNMSVRNTVAGLSDERAVHKGTGAQGVYLHVEGFCW